jgi:hypothetical protein
MAVYRLSDPNNPKIELFGFKLGQRVCKRFEDGTLDQATCGEIVEGFIDEGEQGGDIFAEEYTIELEEGLVTKLGSDVIMAMD